MKKRAQLPWIIEDDTLKTPEHDAAVIYLLNVDNIKMLFPEIKRFLDQPVKTLKIYGSTTQKIWEECKSKGIAPWEYLKNHQLPPIYSDDRYGQDDWSSIQKEYDHLCQLQLEPRSVDISSEMPIENDRNFIIGYWDIVITFSDPLEGGNHLDVFWDDGDNKYKRINIEVKPTIRSFGETLRQLQTYRRYSEGSIYLFTKDTRYKGEFESQGIKVIQNDTKNIEGFIT